MTTASPPTTAERQLLVDEYVELDAVNDVLESLIGLFRVPDADDSRYAHSLDDPPWSHLLPIATRRSLNSAGAGDLFDRLWPADNQALDQDNSPELAELNRAGDRARLLAANLLAALAANPDYLLRQAAWILEGAAANGGA